MDILNILYTPVEIPEPPMFDRKKLKEWCALNINQDFGEIVCHTGLIC